MPPRVIAGRARGVRLKAYRGDRTRPIMDRVKEALFSIIGEDIIDSYFLDLFAGTGGVGIEALSRGAKQVLFIDKHRSAIVTIRDNLKRTRLDTGALSGSVMPSIYSLVRRISLTTLSSLRRHKHT